MNIIRYTAFIICIVVLSTLLGCAKFPAKPAVTGKQLVLTLTVVGRINYDDVNKHYFVAIDNDNDPNTGPLAVASFGGNGWATSIDPVNSIGLTSYVRLDAQNPDGYIYRVLPGQNFLVTSRPQPPIRTVLVDQHTIRFVVDLSQINTGTIPARDITQLDINFITTNRFAVSEDFIEDREFDGLGPTGQDYVSVDTTQDRVYKDFDIDTLDVIDPDLDIYAWEIEVQTVSNR